MSTRPGLAGVGSSGTWTSSDPGPPGPQHWPRATSPPGVTPRCALRTGPCKVAAQRRPRLGWQQATSTDQRLDGEGVSEHTRFACPSPFPLQLPGGRGVGKVPSGTSSKGCTPIGQCVFIWLLSLRVTSESACRASLRCGLGVPQAAGV